MPALSHIGLGLASKRVVPRIPVLVLIFAALALDILAGVFWIAGQVQIIPVDNLAWSHGLFTSLMWSIVVALLAGGFYRRVKAALMVGFLVFSHWLLDFLMWPTSESLLYSGGPPIGLNFGSSIVVATVFEFGVLIIGIFIYIRTLKVEPHFIRRLHKKKQDPE